MFFKFLPIQHGSLGRARAAQRPLAWSRNVELDFPVSLKSKSSPVCLMMMNPAAQLLQEGGFSFSQPHPSRSSSLRWKLAPNFQHALICGRAALMQTLSFNLSSTSLLVSGWWMESSICHFSCLPQQLLLPEREGCGYLYKQLSPNSDCFQEATINFLKSTLRCFSRIGKFSWETEAGGSLQR